MTTYPAITLWQPWASLIFTGDKRHETRGFRLPDRLIGEVVAIHAASRQLPGINGRLATLLRDRFASDALRYPLPRGEVLGVVRFGSPRPTDPDVAGHAVPSSEADRIAGDWAPGRYAWPIVLAQALSEPIPAKGRQGWWKVELDGVRI